MSDVPSGRRRTDGARILIVEDNDDLRMLMQFALQSEGYRVDAAPSAEEGLRLIEAHAYDLLLTDFALPGHTGVWLLRQARALLRDTPALLVTGEPDAAAIHGDIHVVPKPLNFDAFLPQIRAILGDALRVRSEAPATQSRVELVLYVSPESPPCARAIRTLRELLQGYEAGDISWTICDVTREPEAAAAARVVFTPALVKRTPPPPVWILGAPAKVKALDDLLESCGVMRRADS